MANADIPTGLKPVAHLQGIPLHQVPVWWFKHASGDSVAIGLYDPVTVVDLNTDENFPIVEQVDAGDRITGVAVAFRTDCPEGPVSLVGSDSIGRLEYAPASTQVYVGVIRDPYVIYEAQDDGDTTQILARNVGSVADLIVAAASTTTGLSQVEIDSSTVAAYDTSTTGGSAQVQILRLAPSTDGSNVLGANANWWVRIFEHDLLNTVAGV
jgi:hypothetical protein